MLSWTLALRSYVHTCHSAQRDDRGAIGRSTRPLRVHALSNCWRLDQHVRVTAGANLQRCLRGGDTSALRAMCCIPRCLPAICVRGQRDGRADLADVLLRHAMCDCGTMQSRWRRSSGNSSHLFIVAATQFGLARSSAGDASSDGFLDCGHVNCSEVPRPLHELALLLRSRVGVHLTHPVRRRALWSRNTFLRSVWRSSLR
jgi:hypothetical protein